MSPTVSSEGVPGETEESPSGEIAPTGDEPALEPEAAVNLSPIADYDFDGFQAWARPIDDVLEVGYEVFENGFSREISELTPHSGRLWIGYGDANVNLGGEVPITFRSFTSAEDVEVEIGLESGEEQLDRFRLINGTLWMAGVDSTGADEQVHFPAIGGNMYTLSDEGWVKHNTVPGGEHVHDVASWGGAAWSVGSGADDRPEFEAAEIHRYLWRSINDGKSWMTIHREPFPVTGNGDTRWVHLLPQADDLYLFGYEYNWVESRIEVVNARFDGWEVHRLTKEEPLEDVYASGVLPLTEQVALLWGVDVDEAVLRNEAWVVENGQRTPISYLQGRTLIDVSFRPESGELLFLSYDDDTYGESPESWELALHLAKLEAPGEAVEIKNWSSAWAPRCVAFFDGSLFMGTANGDVLKAQGHTKR